MPPMWLLTPNRDLYTMMLLKKVCHLNFEVNTFLATYLCSDVSQGGCTILNSALTDGISIVPTIYVANIVSQTLTSCYGSSRFVMWFNGKRPQPAKHFCHSPSKKGLITWSRTKILRFMSHETKVYSVTPLENSSRVKSYGKGDEFHFETRVLCLINGWF